MKTQHQPSVVPVKQRKIPVVCVSSHQHVLEHIHDILRRRRLLSQQWKMLHFDAHADLACPGDHIPAVCCFQPRREVSVVQKNDARVTEKSGCDKDARGVDDDVATKTMNLYELLDLTASGIAEWILPLVLAANLESVHWIRPAITVRLIPTGSHTYNVGAWIPPAHHRGDEEAQQHVQSFLDLPETALVRVDWHCSYYSEDKSCTPKNELVLAKPLHLTVEEVKSFPPQADKDDGDSSVAADIFSLDVCLDYFACLNPFVSDIEMIDPNFANAIVAVVVNTSFYKRTDKSPSTETHGISSKDSLHYSKVLEFRRLLTDLLKYCDGNDTHSWKDYNVTVESMISFYESNEEGKHLIEAMISSLLRRNYNEERGRLIEMAIEAIPNLTMPHEQFAANATISSSTSLQQRLKHLDSVVNTEQYRSKEPFIITIARSSDDGFTPLSLVEELQANVLEILHERYCGCKEPNLLGLRPPSVANNGGISDCRFDLIFDYGEWEGSTFDRVHN